MALVKLDDETFKLFKEVRGHVMIRNKNLRPVTSDIIKEVLNYYKQKVIACKK